MKTWISILLMILIAGCSRRPRVDTEPASLGGGTTPSYKMSELRIYQTRQDNDPPHTIAEGHFYHIDSATSVFAGVLTINDSVIPMLNIGGTTMYHRSYPADSSPFAMNGTIYRIHLSGSTAFPAFSDSLPAPATTTIITSPASGGTVSKAAGCALQWGAGSSAGVLITVIDTSTAIGSKGFDTTLISDPGTFTITPTMLAPLAPGPGIISVTRANRGFGSPGPHSRYRLAIASEHHIGIIIGP